VLSDDDGRVLNIGVAFESAEGQGEPLIRCGISYGKARMTHWGRMAPNTPSN